MPTKTMATVLSLLREALQSEHLTMYAESRIRLAIQLLERTRN